MPLDARLTYRGLGLIWKIDFNNIDSSLAIECVHKAFDNKLICKVAGRRDGVLKLMPPLTIEDETLENGLSLIKEAVKDVIS